MTISKKIALGLLISAIVPSTYAMDKAAVQSVLGSDFQGTNAEATRLASRPDAVLEVRKLAEIDRPHPHALLAAVTAAPTAAAAVLVEKAAVVDNAIRNGSFGLVDHADLTTDIAKKISLLHDANEDVTDANAVDAAQDPLIAKFILGDPNFQRAQVAAFKQFKAIRDAKGADLSDDDEDDVVENLNLYNLGYSVADATPNLREVYDQLTTGQRHGVDVEVKIQTPTKVDVDTLAALSAAHHRDPSPEDFNVVKTVFADKEFAQQTRNMTVASKGNMATIALNFRNGANEPIFPHAVGAAYYLQNVLHVARINGADVENMLKIEKTLDELGLVKDTGDLETAVYPGFVRILLDILQPNGKLNILGNAEANLDADTIRLLGYLREAEVAAAGAVNPTALTVATDVTEKGRDIARRVDEDSNKYLFAGSEYLDPTKIAAVTLLDGFIREDNINDDKIVAATQVVTSLPVGEHTPASFKAVWKLLNNRVAHATPDQIRGVRAALAVNNIADAIAWKIGNEIAANANYLPVAIATYAGVEGGSAKFNINYGPAAFAANAARVTAPAVANSSRTILVAPANLPAKATAAPWAVGDIAFFTNLQDDAVNADLVTFDHGDAAFPGNAR